jgi:trehalose-phosphatase
VNALDRSLVAALDKVARVPHLLVACDYDGTLAPIVDNPNQAVPLPEAVTALRRLAEMPNTTVAVVSSRPLHKLSLLSRLPHEVLLRGSHGIEVDITFEQTLEPGLLDLRTRLRSEVDSLTRDLLPDGRGERLAGIWLEEKPAGVAVHTRTAEPAVAALVEQAMLSTFDGRTDIFVTLGKRVIDLAVLKGQKHVAVEELRSHHGAHAVVFVGDDTADEDVFRRLRGPDVGVKVGAGETAAGYRVADPVQTVAVLDELAGVRHRWINGSSQVPINRHSMLSNGQTVALLTPDAKVNWFCHPRPDSSALFADLLGGPSAGYFAVGPADGQPLQGQRYREDTMTVETRWNDLTVTDWLDAPSPSPSPSTSTSPSPEGGTTLVRWLSGRARVRIDFAPQPDFGQTMARFDVFPDGLVVTAGTEPIALRAPGVLWQIEDGIASAVVDLPPQGLVLELRCGTTDLAASRSTVEERLAAVEQPWRDWAAKLTLPVTAREETLRSALTLRGLWHRPTGAFLAAATTSLPEVFRGERNWDYRYCWLRDATMSARELVSLGSLEEAESLLGWIDGCVERTGGHPELLRPLYALDGSDLGPETVIETLPGYRGSRPVRVGNLAKGQVQLDVFGPVADLVAAVATARGSMHDREWHLLTEMVAAVQRRWYEEDFGIWEPPNGVRHRVHSKVMCWWTVQRALDVAGLRPGFDPAPWTALRDEIRVDIMDRGWNPRMGAFSESYDFDDVDAATLWVGLTGLVGDDDPQFHDTLLAVERKLRQGPTVFRYKWDDGLNGVEGGFHICTTWLIEAYLRTGRSIEADGLFRQYLAMLGPTGLMPEMYDPVEEVSLGNHPQAYSHLGLIRCALLFDRHRALAPIPGQPVPREPVSA